MLQALYASALIIFATLWSVPVMAQPVEPGTIGGHCDAAGADCAQGVCDLGIGICVSCGMPGEAACEDQNGVLSCYLSGQGYAQISIGTGGAAICANTRSDDCGQVGTAACMRDGAPYCYYGTPVGAAGAGVFCAACGDFGQACCANTVSECDYGSCQGGTCLPAPDTAGAQITAAIDACRFKEALTLINALPVGSAQRNAAQAALDRAKAREDRVNALFEASKGVFHDARLKSLAQDYGNAALAFMDALARLQRARALTQCESSLLTIDQSIVIAARNVDQSQTEVAIAIATDALDQCLFDLASDSIAGITAPNAQKETLARRLDEMRAIEARVLTMYQAAQALNATGKAQLENNRFGEALFSFNAAHAAFSQVRQLTNCADTRNQIDEALAIVGRNIMRADRGAPDVATPEVATPEVAAPSAPHVCLDPSIPATHYVLGYRRYLGGGGASMAMKGQIICGLDGDFSVLSNDALVAYSCDREGQTYVNCRETQRKPVDSWDVVHDGVTYRFDGGDSWIVIHERE